MEKNSSGNTHLLLKWNQQLIKTESSKLKNSLLNISEGQSIISQRLLQNKLHNLIVNTASLENEIYDQQAIETVLKKYYVKTTESTLCKNELKIKGYIEAFIESAICSPGPISNQLLHKWQQSMFPYSRSGMFNIVSGYWRLDSLGIIPAFESMPTKKKVLLNGPKSSEIEGAMSKFIEWYFDWS